MEKIFRKDGGCIGSGCSVTKWKRKRKRWWGCQAPKFAANAASRNQLLLSHGVAHTFEYSRVIEHSHGNAKFDALLCSLYSLYSYTLCLLMMMAALVIGYHLGTIS